MPRNKVTVGEILYLVSGSLGIVHHDSEGMTTAATVHGLRKMLPHMSKEGQAEKGEC